MPHYFLRDAYSSKDETKTGYIFPQRQHFGALYVIYGHRPLLILENPENYPENPENSKYPVNPEYAENPERKKIQNTQNIQKI